MWTNAVVKTKPVQRCESQIRALFLHAGEQRPADEEPVLLSRILGDVLDFLAFECRKYRVLVVNHVSSRPSVYVRLSPETLYPLLLNLLGSALSAIEAACATGRKDQHRITIDVEPCTKGWDLCVKDTGCGVAAEDLRRLLRPLFRAKGLSFITSRNVVRAFRGDLSIETETGVGTAIHVRLPGV